MTLREVIVLHYVADLPVGQIARECGMSSTPGDAERLRAANARPRECS